MNRGLVIAIVGLLTLAGVCSAPSTAATWPEAGKIMTMIVPWPAGGPSDVPARLLSTEMSKSLGIPVQVVNKPGAGTEIGMTALALSKPDGYTIGQVAIPTAFPIYMDPTRKSVFDPRNLTAIGQQYEDHGVIAVRADSPFKTVKDLVNAAKAKPDKIKVSNTSILGLSHLIILQLEKLEGIKLAPVSFNGGGPAVLALLAGDIDAHFGTVNEIVAQVKAGNVRALAVTAKVRNVFLPPDIPTITELGYPIIMTNSRIYAVRSDTPVEVVQRIRQAFKEVMEIKDMKERLYAIALQMSFLDGEAAAKYWTDVETIVGPLIKSFRMQ